MISACATWTKVSSGFTRTPRKMAVTPTCRRPRIRNDDLHTAKSRSWWLAIAVLHSGCATIHTLSADEVEGHMYEVELCLPEKGTPSLPRALSGSASDVQCIAHGKQDSALCLLDLPLSFIADIVVSPYTIVQQAKHGAYRPRFVPKIHDELERQAERDSVRCLCPSQDPAGLGAPPPPGADHCVEDHVAPGSGRAPISPRR